MYFIDAKGNLQYIDSKNRHSDKDFYSELWKKKLLHSSKEKQQNIMDYINNNNKSVN